MNKQIIKTCPHCEDGMAYEDLHYARYKCGAVVWLDGSTSYVDKRCLMRQLSIKNVEIDRLRNAMRTNFHLIEAAPDLLAACEWALKKIQCVPHLDDPDCYACGLNPLRIAIAKARGER